MKKFLLSLCVAMLSVVGAWAQFYKFTGTAQGNLYTEANDGAVATITAGTLCDQNYFVKSDYTALTSPLPFTLTDGAQEFAVKDYYLNNDGNYTCAFGEAYVSTNAYATANATLITEANKSEYYGVVGVFNSAATTKIKKTEYIDGNWVATDEFVSQGETCYDDVYYDTNGMGLATGEALKGSGWAWLGVVENIAGFTKPNIYTLTDGIYTKISASDKYGDGKDYYAVEFNDLAADYTFPDGTFSASQVIESITADYIVYYYNGSSYAEVQEGDEYLGEGKYFKNEPGFTSKTPAELVALGYVKAVGAITEVSEDGKTLTILCSGDVCEPDDEFSTEGYKFAAKAVNTIYPGEVENSVKQDEIYNENQEYYTRAQKYVQKDIDITSKLILKNAVSAYKLDGKNYMYYNLGAGDDVPSGSWNTLDGTDSPLDNIDDYVYVEKNFLASAHGYIYKVTLDGEGNIVSNEAAGYAATYDPNATYAYTSAQWNADNLTVLSEGDMSAYVESTGVTKIKQDADLYKKDNNNLVNVSGQNKEEIEYYAVTATSLDLTSETYATSVDCVNTNGEEYFTLSGMEYNQVANGSEFTGSQSDYYVKDGYDYFGIARATMIEDSYMTSATVAENYWEALVNEINAAGYETVVFTTKEGDAEHATICEHVTRAMMKTTTVNALDYQFVQIASLEPLSIKDQNGEWQDNPKSTFWASSANTSVTVLLLPEIKNAKDVNGVEHRHVPQVCNNFWSLNLIVMPNNATCIEEGAFIRNSFNGGITEYELKTIVFNNTLKRIGKDAFNGHIGLNNLTFPASMEYIGKNAFDGGIKDVYFLGEKAPIVEKDAFSDKAYLCNNAIKDNYIINDWYRVDRNAYVNGDYMAAMLHVPTGIAANNLAAYTDPTRHYHVFEWLPYEIEAKDVVSEKEAEIRYPFASSVETREDKIYVKFDAIHSNDITKEVDYTNGQTRAMVYYCSGDASGESISPSWGSAAAGANAMTDGGRVWGTDSWINGYNHNKSSGLYDLYAGDNYVWPCQAFMNRGFDVASHGLLWNGTSTIADGINGTSNGVVNVVTATYDADCDGVDDKSYTDGKEYMGLHEFILVSADVAPNTNTQEWDFNTIAGANWYTICVPVSMTVEEVRATFGEDTQVCKFNKVSRDSEDKIKFGFTDEQCYGKTDLSKVAIEANYAYMIRPSKYKDADTKFVLPHYTIADKVIPIPTTITCTDANDNNPDKVYSYTFIGNYNTNADGTPLYMQQYCYYLGIDKNDPNIHKLFMQSGNTGKWKPYSCVIIPSDGKSDFDTFFDPNRSNTNKSKATTCYFGMDSYEEEGNGATAIEYTVVCGSEKNSPIFNLNGQIVGNNIDKLPQGVYVKNGKKFIVK